MSYIKTWNFRMDAVKQYLGEAISIIRQDTYSNKFVITCLNNGYPIDLTDVAYATVTFTKADNNVVVSTADVVDAAKGRIEVMIDYQAITVIGICTVSVKLYFGPSVVTLSNFPINVILDPYVGTDAGVVSSSEYPVLTQLILDVINGYAPEGNIPLSMYRLNKDANGIFTTIEYRDTYGTLYMKSVLSSGTPPLYEIRTETYYEEDGITVRALITYHLIYDSNDDLITEEEGGES